MRLKFFGHLGHWNLVPGAVALGLGFAGSFGFRLLLVLLFPPLSCVEGPGPSTLPVDSLSISLLQQYGVLETGSRMGLVLGCVDVYQTKQIGGVDDYQIVFILWSKITRW